LRPGPIVADQLVAELNLGFWVSLLGRAATTRPDCGGRRCGGRSPDTREPVTYCTVSSTICERSVTASLTTRRSTIVTSRPITSPCSAWSATSRPTWRRGCHATTASRRCWSGGLGCVRRRCPRGS